MGQPSADSNGSLVPFLFEFQLSGSGVTVLKQLTIMVRQRGITICRGQEHPKGRKGTLRHDFQANIRPRIFVKKPMSPQDTGIQL